MALTIKLKSSVVRDKVPSAADIEIGEVCVGANSQSPMLLFKDNADNIIQIKPGSGVTPGPNPPADKQPGDIWYDENTNSLKYWNGSQWVELEASTGSSVDSVNGQSGVVVLKTSDLENNSGYITAADIPDVPDAPVASVNSKTGVVVLAYGDVGAASAEQGGKADTALQPGVDISELNNDAGFITDAGVVKLVAGSNITLTPAEGTGEVKIDAAGGGGGGAVDSVNGETGTVVLTAADVGALPDTTAFVTSVNGDIGPEITLTAVDVGALPDTTPLDFVPMGSWDAIAELV